MEGEGKREREMGRETRYLFARSLNSMSLFLITWSTLMKHLTLNSVIDIASSILDNAVSLLLTPIVLCGHRRSGA